MCVCVCVCVCVSVCLSIFGHKTLFLLYITCNERR